MEIIDVLERRARDSQTPVPAWVGELRERHAE